MSVYAREKPEYLEASIKSMLRQTYLTNDFVIVKDGSLPESLERILDFYSNKQPNLFNIIALEENVGLGKALDKGMNYCKNELIARMDSDDISLPTRCAKQIEIFNSFPEYDLIGSMVDEFCDDPAKIVTSRIVPTAHSEILKFIRRRNPFNHPTVMYRKSAVLNSGGYGGIPTRQDLDLFSRMIHKGYKATNINESLVLFRANKNYFIRKKSWRYCKGDIYVRYRQWKRGESSLLDFTNTTVIFLVMLVSPMWLMKIVSSKMLRKPKIKRVNYVESYRKKSK